MTCLNRNFATMEDIIAEGNKPGNIEPIGGLDEADTTAVLAAVAQNVEGGIGDYGLTVDKLIEAGVVKPGLGEITDLSDPSVFTGCGAVRKLEDVLSRQRDIVIAAANHTVEKLIQDGVTECAEPDNELAAEVAGLATQYNAKQIKDFLKVKKENKSLLDSLGLDFLSDIPLDKIGQLAGIATLGVALFQNMGKIADAAKNAVKMIGDKAGALVDKVKGLGKSASSLPDKAKGTVETAELDAEVDKLVGSKRIPSFMNPDEIAKIAIGAVGVAAAIELTGGGADDKKVPLKPGSVDVAKLKESVNKATSSLDSGDLFC